MFPGPHILRKVNVKLYIRGTICILEGRPLVFGLGMQHLHHYIRRSTCLVMLRGIDTPGRRCRARPLIGEQYALKALQVLLTQE